MICGAWPWFFWTYADLQSCPQVILPIKNWRNSCITFSIRSWILSIISAGDSELLRWWYSGLIWDWASAEESCPWRGTGRDRNPEILQSAEARRANGLSRDGDWHSYWPGRRSLFFHRSGNSQLYTVIGLTVNLVERYRREKLRKSETRHPAAFSLHESLISATNLDSALLVNIENQLMQALDALQHEQAQITENQTQSPVWQ